jgi:hypothetical protein
VDCRRRLRRGREGDPERRQALLLGRLRLGLFPPEGPRRFFLLSQSDPLRAHEWMTTREALEIATRGGGAVLGRHDIGSLEAGKWLISSVSTCTPWILRAP